MHDEPSVPRDLPSRSCWLTEVRQPLTHRHERPCVRSQHLHGNMEQEGARYGDELKSSAECAFYGKPVSHAQAQSTSPLPRRQSGENDRS
jgi:hypothetical protein